MNSSIYHIGFGVDEKYAKYAGVLMTNIVLTHLGQPIFFHIACDGLSAEDRKRFDQFAVLYKNVRVYLYDASKFLDSLNPISSKASPRLHRAVLLRVLLPIFVPKDVKRLLYMDVDMLCLDRLDELWRIDMKGMAVGATKSDSSTETRKRMNAGILLYDVPLWNKNNFSQKVVSCFQKYSEKMLAVEEDAINTVLKGDFFELSDRFSFLIEVNNPLTINIGEDTAALHFIKEAKPWTKGCVPYIHDIYWRYVRQSLWYDMEMLEPTTIKAAFFAGITAELQGNHEEACKYYGAVARKLTEYYVEDNKAWLFGNKAFDEDNYEE